DSAASQAHVEPGAGWRPSAPPARGPAQRYARRRDRDQPAELPYSPNVPPAMSQESTPYDQKLESILRTAASVFAERGYHRASIRDISRATGVSLAGLYYYFQSKEELLFLIQDHALEQLIGGAEERVVGVTDPRERLRRLM